MTLRAEMASPELAELLKVVQSGEVVELTQGSKVVAKIVPVAEENLPQPGVKEYKPMNLRALKGHKVLTPNFTHAEIAEEMFGERWPIPEKPVALGQ